MTDIQIPLNMTGSITCDPVAIAVLHFSGKIISLFVHELNNHLATIREYSGLADDILAARTFSDEDKLQEMGQTIDTIERRVNLAASLIKNFGSIGRHIEESSALLDPDAAISELMPFLLKTGKQKNINVRHSPGRNMPRITGDQTVFQCLTFALFENLCSGLHPQTVVSLSTGISSASVVISLKHDQPPASVSDPNQWSDDTLRALAEKLASDISKTEGGVDLKLAVNVS